MPIIGHVVLKQEVQMKISHPDIIMHSLRNMAGC